MSIPITEAREPNMAALVAMLYIPPAVAIIVVLLLSINEDFQYAGIDTKGAALLWIIGLAVTAMLTGAGVWSIVYRKWIGILAPLAMISLGLLIAFAYQKTLFLLL